MHCHIAIGSIHLQLAEVFGSFKVIGTIMSCWNQTSETERWRFPFQPQDRGIRSSTDWIILIFLVLYVYFAVLEEGYWFHCNDVDLNIGEVVREKVFSFDKWFRSTVRMFSILKSAIAKPPPIRSTPSRIHKTGMASAAALLYLMIYRLCKCALSPIQMTVSSSQPDNWTPRSLSTAEAIRCKERECRAGRVGCSVRFQIGIRFKCLQR